MLEAEVRQQNDRVLTRRAPAPAAMLEAGQSLQAVRCAFPTEIYTLEDAIEFHAFAPLEALAMRVTNGIPLGRLLSYHYHHKLCPNTVKQSTASAASNHELCHHTDDVAQH
jgi:hypothetical protein